jgi:hypothetical protein
MDVAEPISVWGYPNYIFNQTAADVESTAVAMFGIRVAAEQGVLPAETWRPKGEDGRALTTPRRAVDVLGRVLSAVCARQNPDGSWGEMNVHQPVTHFDKLGAVPGLPADADSFKELDSPSTQTSTAQAYSVLANLARIPGGPGLASHGEKVAAGAAALGAALDGGLSDVEGGHVAPYDFCFAAHTPSGMGDAAHDVKAWNRVGTFLLDSQNEDGSWGGKPSVQTMLPSSFRARMAVLPTLRSRASGRAVALSDAHVPVSDRDGKHAGDLRKRYGFDTRVISTAYALLILTSGPGGDG